MSLRVREMPLSPPEREALSVGPWTLDADAPETVRKSAVPYSARWLRLYCTTLRWMIADPHTGWWMAARLWATWALMRMALWVAFARCGQR